jgi:hypothetical protein
MLKASCTIRRYRFRQTDSKIMNFKNNATAYVVEHFLPDIISKHDQLPVFTYEKHGIRHSKPISF